jgi:hypothetical protein
MRCMFVVAAAMTAAMPGFMAGLLVAMFLNFHDGDEGKALASAIGCAFLAALAAGRVASHGFARLGPRWQLRAAVLSFAVAFPLFAGFLSLMMH